MIKRGRIYVGNKDLEGIRSELLHTVFEADNLARAYEIEGDSAAERFLARLPLEIVCCGPEPIMLLSITLCSCVSVMREFVEDGLPMDRSSIMLRLLVRELLVEFIKLIISDDDQLCKQVLLPVHMALDCDEEGIQN